MSEFNCFANPKENCGLAHNSTAKAWAVGTGPIFFWPGPIQHPVVGENPTQQQGNP